MITLRRLEIMQGIARGGVLKAAGWNSIGRDRWRDYGKQKLHCSFHITRVLVSGHQHVTSGLIEKMVACGLIEAFKPHAGVPCYRLTAKGHLSLCLPELPVR
jgi:hypothetical protein